MRRRWAGDEPKTVFVPGRINANPNAAGGRLTCEDYARDGYTLHEYLDTYDPDVLGPGGRAHCQPAG